MWMLTQRFLLLLRCLNTVFDLLCSQELQVEASIYSQHCLFSTVVTGSTDGIGKAYALEVRGGHEINRQETFQVQMRDFFWIQSGHFSHQN